jgi:hypothetical protein
VRRGQVPGHGSENVLNVMIFDERQARLREESRSVRLRDHYAIFRFARRAICGSKLGAAKA